MKSRRIIILAIVLFASCAIVDESKLSENTGPRRIISRGLTKAYSPEDSIRRLHAFQSDKEKMLLYQIKKRNGTYVLDLTKEDAKELNIPDSLYLWATQVVESLNKED